MGQVLKAYSRRKGVVIMKLSIIIPYYKTLDLTKELLEVLIPQLNSNSELIIVDDGCNEIELDQYKKFINVNVIHKENGGVSSARNSGLDIYKGDYAVFIDSDDMIPKYYIDKALDKINNTIFDYCLFSWRCCGKVSEELKDIDYIMHYNDVDYDNVVWNCIYSRKMIGDNRFNENLNVSEDKEFNITVRRDKGYKREIIRDIMYYYRAGRVGSLCYNHNHGLLPKYKVKNTRSIVDKVPLDKLVLKGNKKYLKQVMVPSEIKSAPNIKYGNYKGRVYKILNKDKGLFCDNGSVFDINTLE